MKYCNHCQMIMPKRHFQIKSRAKIEEIVSMSKICKGLAQTSNQVETEMTAFHRYKWLNIYGAGLVPKP